MPFTMLSPDKIPLSSWSRAGLPRRSLKKKRNRQGNCCWFARLSVTVEIKRFCSHQVIAMIPAEFSVIYFFRFGAWLISRKHSFQWNYGITAVTGNTDKTDVLKVPCCLQGLLHLPGKPCTVITWIRLWFSGI